MKKYDFKNYITHKSAEVHSEMHDRNCSYIVWYSRNGKPDRNPYGTGDCGSSAELFTSEADAIRSAERYVAGNETIITKRDLWLKLFIENDTALASAIHLCERFVTQESLDNGQDFICKKRAELYDEVERDAIESVFSSRSTKA